MADNLTMPEPTNVDRWLRVTDAMRITSLGRSSIYQQMELGNLRSVKCGGARRIPESALREFMAKYDGSGEITA